MCEDVLDQFSNGHGVGIDFRHDVVSLQSPVEIGDACGLRVEVTEARPTVSNSHTNLAEAGKPRAICLSETSPDRPWKLRSVRLLGRSLEELIR